MEVVRDRAPGPGRIPNHASRGITWLDHPGAQQALVVVAACIVFLGTIGSPPSLLDDVDSAYARAIADGIANLWPPVDAGPIVGYYCGVPDADGNMVEFSFGQRIG